MLVRNVAVPKALSASTSSVCKLFVFFKLEMFLPSPAGAASERRVWLLEMCEERDPEGRPGGPGRLRQPVLSDQVCPDDDLEENKPLS